MGTTPPLGGLDARLDGRGLEQRESFADSADQALFERFLNEAEREFDRIQAGCEQPEARFRVVSSVDDLERLQAEGNPWAAQAWRFGEYPLPFWAMRREAELMRGMRHR